MSKTIFIDIDGTLIKHQGSLEKCIYGPVETIQYTEEKIQDWMLAGHRVIITTARPESTRKQTIKTLEECRIMYDMLIMGLPHGPRVVINDAKPNIGEMAVGITIKRNSGICEIEL